MNTQQKAWVLALGLCTLVQFAQSTPISSPVSCAYENLAEAHICSNDSFYFGQSWLRAEGSYQATFQDVNGCDSIVHLSLWHMPNSFTEMIMHLCEGQSLKLSGHTITEAGTYQLHYLASWGCDSTVLLHVKEIPSVSTSLTKTLCQGDSLFFGTRWLYESGTYQSSFARQGACDSLVTLTLDVIRTRAPLVTETDGLLANIPADSYQWLTCPGYFPVPDGTDSKLTITGEGNYSVRVQNKGCIDTLDCTYFKRNMTALAGRSELEITVYPNPVSETLHIQGDFSSAIHIRMMNTLGQLVLEKTLQPEKILLLEVDGLSKGHYILHITENGHFIKQSQIVIQ